MPRRTTCHALAALLALAALGGAGARADTRIGDDVKTGIETTVDHDREPFGYRVLWIDFDSPFRKSDLRIGDLIVGVDEVRYRREEYQQRRGIGDTAEADFWADRHARDAQPVTLAVLRDGGEIRVTGALRAERLYTTREGRRALQDGGPETLKNDGFDGAWSGWYEDFVKSCSYVLDGGWEYRSFNSRKRLADHLDLKPRVDYLAAHYPGPLADSVVADYARVEESLRGKRIELSAADLAYRGAGEDRAKQVAADGAAAREALLAAVKGDVIEPFPALDPAAGDRSAVVGKVVDLPPVGMDCMINDLGRSFFVAGSRSDGFYFVECNDPDMTLFFGAYYRYRGLVDPAIRESFAIVGRIRDDPRMITFREEPVTGMTLDVLGVSVDDKVFVDLRPLKGGAARPGEVAFAGEEKVGAGPPAMPGDSAPPEEVLAAFIATIKAGDYDRWHAFFADWQIIEHADGTAIYVPGSDQPERNYARAFETSRKLILGDVYDARVARVSPVKALIAGDPAASVPRVERVAVTIEHYGLFDGEYRSFVDIRVNRRWVLERVGGGPWRILEIQSL